MASQAGPLVLLSGKPQALLEWNAMADVLETSS